MVRKRSEAQLQKAALVRDLNEQLAAGKKQRKDKLEQSVEQLKAQLEMASKKYLTVNGYMQARSTYEQALFGEEGFDAELSCRELALEMSLVALGLVDKLETTNVNDLDESLFDGLLIEDFVSASRSTTEVVRQLLIVNLLQNVGPAIDDIVQFRVGVDAGIESIKEELAKHKVVELKPADAN